MKRQGMLLAAVLSVCLAADSGVGVSAAPEEDAY